MNDDNFLCYDRITDTIMYFNTNISLDFIVSLSYKRRDGNRQFFHSEFDKVSNYRLTDISKTIRRNCRYYYAINIKNDFGGGLVLKHSDVYILTTGIEQKVLPWFFGDKRIFKVIDKRLNLVGEIEPFMYPQSEYKYLSIVPIVQQYEDGLYKEGVRCFVNSADCNFDLSLDDFLGFYHILKTTDMYNLASNMMLYAKVPPYDINASSITPGLGSGARFEQEESVGNYTSRSSGSLGSAKNFLNNTKKK